MDRDGLMQIGRGVEGLEDRTLLATFLWDGGPTGTGSTFGDAENWVGDIGPGEQDDAVIGSAFSGAVIEVNSNETVLSVDSSAPIVVSGSLTLGDRTGEWTSTFAETLTVDADATLEINRTTLNGTADLILNGELRALRASNAIKLPLQTATTSTLTVEAVNSSYSTQLTIDTGFVNNGTIELSRRGNSSSANALQFDVTRGALVNSNTGVIRASAERESSVNILMSAQLQNEGDLIVEANLLIDKSDVIHTTTAGSTIELTDGDLTIVQMQSETDNSGPARFETSGSIIIGNEQTLTIDGGVWTQQAGTVTGNGTFELDDVTATVATDFSVPNFTLTQSSIAGQGRLITADGRTFTIKGSQIELPLDNHGTVDVQRPGNQFNEDFTNDGTLLVGAKASSYSTQLTIANGFTNNGTVSLHRSGNGSAANSAELIVANGPLVNAANGVIEATSEFTPNITLKLSAELENHGTVIVDHNLALEKGGANHVMFAGSTVDVSGGNLSVKQTGSGGSFLNNGMIDIAENFGFEIDGTPIQNVSGTLTGDGTIFGDVLQTGGTISPGSSVGELTIKGDLTQTGGEIAIELLGLEATEYDTLRVDGNVSLGGSLNIQLGKDFTPETGDQFPILFAQDVSAEFTSTNAADLGLSVQQTSDSVTLVGTDIAPPIVWDLGPLGSVSARAEFLTTPGPQGELATLSDVVFELLPSQNGDEPFAILSIDAAIAFDTDDNPLTLETFAIQNASAIFESLDLGVAGLDIVTLRDVLIRIPSFSNHKGLSGSIELIIGSAELFPDTAEITAHAELIQGNIEVTSQSGDASGAVSLHALHSELKIGESIAVATNDLNIEWNPKNSAVDATVATLGNAVLTFPNQPQFPSAEINGLEIRRNGVSIDSFEINIPGSGSTAASHVPESEAVISGFVWFDTDKDGQVDGVEKFLGNYNVRLIDAITGATVQQVTTNESGEYNFATEGGVYRVQFVSDNNARTEFSTSAQSVVDSTGLTTETFTVLSGTHFDDIDAGIHAKPVRRPILIVPGIAGTYAADLENDIDWLLERGSHPDKLQIDPLADAYDDIITTLELTGYRRNVDLFVANYDWRVPPAPAPEGDQFDGVIDGISGESISDLKFEYGVDYIGYWLKKAQEQWPGLESVDVIAHSTGGLVTRSYIQSPAYGAIVDGVALPKVHNFIQVGVPNRGASKAWNALHDNWAIDASYSAVLSKILYRPYLELLAGNIITGPNASDTITISDILDPITNEPSHERFVDIYVPTIRGLLATFPFYETPAGLVDVNSNAEQRNSLLLDLNDGLDFSFTPTQGAWDASKDPSQFASLVTNNLVIAGAGVDTPTSVSAETGPNLTSPLTSLISSLDGLPYPPSFGQEWFRDDFATRAGDSTVPLASSVGQFIGDARLDLALFSKTQQTAVGFENLSLNPTAKDAGHLAIMALPETQQRMLQLLGRPTFLENISTTLGGSAKATLNALTAGPGQVPDAVNRYISGVIDPVLTRVLDADGNVLVSYDTESGAYANADSVFLGSDYGHFVIAGDVALPLQVELDGLPGETNDYFVQLSGGGTGLSGGIELSGTLSGSDPTVTHSVDFEQLFRLREGIPDLLEFDSLQVTGSNIDVTIDTTNGSSVSVTGTIGLHADNAAIMPDSSTPELDGVVTVQNFDGSINVATGRIEVSADAAQVQVDNVVTITATSNGSEPAVTLVIDPSNPDEFLATLNHLEFSFPAFPDLPADALAIETMTVRNDGFDLVATVGGTAADFVLDSALGLAAEDVTINLDLHATFVAPTDSVIPILTFTDDSSVSVTAASASLALGDFFDASINDGPDADEFALTGFVDLTDGSAVLNVDQLLANAGQALSLSANNVTVTVNSDAPILAADEASLTMQLMGSNSVVLTATDLLVQSNGEVSVSGAVTQANGGILSAIGLAGILPLDISSVALQAVDRNDDGSVEPIVLNRDADANGLPDGEYDILVNGAFNFDSWSATGLLPSVTIGDTTREAGDAFELSFRQVDGQVVPWNVGPIVLGIAGTPDSTDRIGSLQGNLTLGGYQNGVWQPAISGFLTTQIEDDSGNQTDVRVDVLPESSLVIENGAAALRLHGAIQFDSTVGGDYFGVELQNARLSFEISLGLAMTQTAPFVEVTNFRAALGQFSVSEFQVEFEDLLTLTATDVVIDFNPSAGGPLGSIGTVEIVASANSPLAGLTQASVTISNAKLFSDRIEFASDTSDLPDVIVRLSGTIHANPGDDQSVRLLSVDDLRLNFTDLEIGLGSVDPFSGGQLPSIPFNDASIGQITVSADEIVLLPAADGEASDVTAAVTGIQGTFADNTLVIEVDSVSANAFDGQLLFAVEPPAIDEAAARIVLGSTIDNDMPLVELFGTAVVGVKLLDDKPLELNVAELVIGRDGMISFESASIGSSTETVGIGESLGIAGGFLPIDLTFVEISAPGNQRIVVNATGSGDVVGIDDVDIQVDGLINFNAFGELPFDPVFQIGEDAVKTPGSDAFSVTFRLSDVNSASPKIQIQDLGPIKLGITNFNAGPLELRGSTADSHTAFIQLGGYQNGSWASDVTLDVGLDFDGEAADGGANIAADGDFYLPNDTNNPNPGAATLDLQVLDLSFSFATGTLELVNGELTPTFESGWGLGFENLGVSINTRIAVRIDPILGLQIEAVHDTNGNDLPFVELNGLFAEEFVVDLGGKLQMWAEDVSLNLDAFENNSDGEQVGGEFLSLGTVGIQFGGEGNPLEGLGGTASGFGLGWNPDATVPIELIQKPGAELSISDLNGGGGFGLPDWFPVTISEIGLRFPNSFGDMIPSAGTVEETAAFALDALTNFVVIFSGGVQDSELLPINFQLENVEVDINLLRQYAELILGNLDDDWASELIADPNNIGVNITIRELVNRPVTSGGGALAGIRALGPKMLTLFGDVIEEVEGFGKFPIQLDAIDAGVEPFTLGPIEVGGGIGFGTIAVDTDGDTATADEHVLFGKIEGEFLYAGNGLGLELILTEHGPVLARLKTGVPLPIGTIVGAIAGAFFVGAGAAAGAGIGTASGFVINDFEGALVFDGKPLPTISQPSDLLTDPEIRNPVDIDLSDIRSIVQSLWIDPDGTRRPADDPRSTWGSGFTFVGSGRLTNIHIQGMAGATLELGANVGFDLAALRITDPADVDPQLQSTGEQLQVNDESAAAFPIGLQFFGFGDVDIMGQTLADSGVMFNYSDPLNPQLIMAAALPQPGSVLSMILPVDGQIGLQLNTDGIVAGSVLAAETFVQHILGAGREQFEETLADIADILDTDRESLLSQILLDTNGNQIVDDLENDRSINVDFLRSRLDDVFSVIGGIAPDLTVSLPPSINSAVIAAGELMQAFVVQRGADFAQDVIDIVMDAGNAAANAYFDTIDPSLQISGSIQPVLLGIPIGDSLAEVDVRLDKKGLSVAGKGSLLAPLQALNPVFFPLTDTLNLGVELPFENLFRDLATGQFPEFDPTRDWRGTFQGTVNLYGLDLGDVTGLLFPAIEQGQPVPEDHPLATHVQIIGDDVIDDGGGLVFGPNGAVGDRVFVTQDDFNLLREHGGILVDGRLTIPQFLSDPLAWFGYLQSEFRDVVTDANGDPLPGCEDASDPIACLLANPGGFFEYIQSLPDAVGAEHQIAQVQLFLPNIGDELSNLIDNSVIGDADKQQALATKVRNLFNDIIDNGKADNSLNLPDGEVALIADSDITDLVNTLRDGIYFRGDVGTFPDNDRKDTLPTSGKFLGFDFGGATIQLNGDQLSVSGQFPADADNGLRFEAIIDSANGYPRAGAKVEFGTISDTAEPVDFNALIDVLLAMDFTEISDPDSGNAFASAADWLRRFVPDEAGLGAALHVYSPGFDPEAIDDDPLIQQVMRQGGFAILAEAEFQSDFTHIDGDLNFALLLDANSPTGFKFIGSFNGLVNNIVATGDITADGLMALSVELPDDIEDGEIGIAGSGTFIVNMSDDLLSLVTSDYDYSLERPDGSLQDTIAPDAILLNLEGRIVLPVVSVEGQFLFDDRRDSVEVFGAGVVSLGDFNSLVQVRDGQIDVTVSGGYGTTQDGAYGALLFEADAGFEETEFFGANADLNIAFNTTSESQSFELTQFSLPFSADDDLAASGLTIPAQTVSLLANGNLTIADVGLSATIMAQRQYTAAAGTPAFQVYAHGELDGNDFITGDVGLIAASGFLAIDSDGSLLAAQLELDGNLSPLGTNGPFTLDGSFLFATNQTDAAIDLDLGNDLTVMIPAVTGGYTRLQGDANIGILDASFGGAVEVEFDNLVPISLAIDFNPTAEFDPDVRFDLNVIDNTIRAGVEIDVGAGLDLPLEELDDLLANFGIASEAGAWLSNGTPQFLSDVVLRAYTPGFAPTSADPLKRNGGFKVEADARLSSVFGYIDGGFQFTVTPQSVTGSFDGRAVLSLGPIIGVEVASAAGSIDEFGCVEIVAGGVFGAFGFQFGLTPGSCDPQISIGDGSVLEGETTQLELTIQNLDRWINDGWIGGPLQIFFDVDGDGSILASHNPLLINPTDISNGTVQTSITVQSNLESPAVVEFGEQFTIQIDRIITPGSDFNLTLADELGIVSVTDSGADALNVLPPAPTNFAVYYPFQTNGFTQPANGWNANPSVNSTVPASTMRHSTFAPQRELTSADGFFSDGLPVEGQVPTQGLAALEPSTISAVANTSRSSSTAEPDLADGFQFTIHPELITQFDGRAFLAERLEFWDQPTDGEEWEVYAIVGYDVDNPTGDFADPIQLTVNERIFIEDESSVPGVHPDAIGWRRLEVEFGTSLCDNSIALPLTAPGAPPQSWPCVTTAVPVTIRFVPVKSSTLTSEFSVGQIFPGFGGLTDRNTGSTSTLVTSDSNLLGRRRTIDNIVLYGGERTTGGFSRGGTDFELELNDQTFTFGLTGPGSIEVFDVTAATGFSATDGFVSLGINLVGTDATTEVTVTTTPTDGAVAMPVHLELMAELTVGTVDMTGVPHVGGNMSYENGVGELAFNNILTEASVTIGGTPTTTTSINAIGSIGRAYSAGQAAPLPGKAVQHVSTDGVTIQSAGMVSVDALEVLGGFWNVDSVGIAKTRGGDFSATVNIGEGFDKFEIHGNLLSPTLRAGTSTKRFEGHGNTIQVVQKPDGSGGNILGGDILIDGDINLVEAAGEIRSRIVVDRIGELKIQTTASSASKANFTGTIDAKSIGNVRITGGDLTGSIVTRDKFDTGLSIQVTKDAANRGGVVKSIRSLHIAGGIQELIADSAQLNLIVGGIIEHISITGDADDSQLEGFVTAKAIGDIIVNGNSRLTISTTATANELTGHAINSIQTLGGNWIGGVVSTRPGTTVGRVIVKPGEGSNGQRIGGQVNALLRIESDNVEDLQIETVSAAVEVNGNLDKGTLGIVDAPVVVTGQVQQQLIHTLVTSNGAVTVNGVRTDGGNKAIVDIDRNGELEIFTDGLLVIRGLAGLTGDALVNGAVANGTPADTIETYLETIVTSLDVDGDGFSRALTDGILVIRHLAGFTGNALINGAVESTGTRTTAAEITDYLNQLTHVADETARSQVVSAIPGLLQDDGSISVEVNYSAAEAPVAGTTGLNLRLHYDADQMTLTSVSPRLQHGFTTQQVVADDADDDQDPATTHFINLLWFDVAGGWPDPATVSLLTAHFDTKTNFNASTINFSGQAATGFQLQTEPITVQSDILEVERSAGGLTVTEIGGKTSVDVRLTGRPAADMVVEVSADDTDEFFVKTSQLVFTPDNWATPQTITLKGIDDSELDGTQTGQLRLHIANSPIDQDVTVPVFNLDYEDEVTVTGTDADDTFMFIAGPSHIVRINGTNFEFHSDKPIVRFNPGFGNDSITVRGDLSDDTVVLTTDSISFQSDHYDVISTNSEFHRAYGNGGSDQAQLFGSDNDDVLIMTPGQARIQDDKFYEFVHGFESITAYAGGGHNQANIYDSQGDDQLVHRPESSSLTGDDFELTVHDFQTVRVWASGGFDTAEFFDSESDDRYVATANHAFLQNDNIYRYAQGFDRTTAWSNAGGFDKAQLHDSKSDDILVARFNHVYLIASEFENHVHNFEQTDSFSNQGGIDEAQIYDTTGSDNLIARPGSTNVFNRSDGFNYQNQQTGFKRVLAFSTNGGTDTVKQQIGLDYYFSKSGDWVTEGF